jgi:ArsR family metal-binding transcriptional regulator
MLLESYRLEIFNNQCMPGAMTVQCFAHLGQDVSRALPYLNAELGGFKYIKEPPSVTFRVHGKLMTVYGRKMAINALRNETEAQKIVEWLKNEINRVWKDRENIQPCYQSAPQPQMIEILKLLPKTNCGKCGDPTCMVFATRMTEGAKASSQCPALSERDRTALDLYMKGFVFSDGFA